MARRGRHCLSADSVQKIVTLVLSGSELGIQLIEIIWHVR